MILEDKISRAAAGELILAGDGDEVLRWASVEGGGVTTTQLPLALVGPGSCVAGKIRGPIPSGCAMYMIPISLVWSSFIVCAT